MCVKPNGLDLMAVGLVSTVFCGMENLNVYFYLFPLFHIFVIIYFSYQEKVCLRYQFGGEEEFLHEAEMANLLRHQNVLAIYGVVIASSYSPTLALVSNS